MIGPAHKAAMTLALVSLIAPGLALCGSTSSAYRSKEDLMALFYDYEVAGYCGLVSEPVARGFDRRLRHALDANPIEQETLDHLRGKAWQAAHEEWQNRGLGGFKRWCANEGSDSAARLR